MPDTTTSHTRLDRASQYRAASTSLPRGLWGICIAMRTAFSIPVHEKYRFGGHDGQFEVSALEKGHSD